MSLEQPILGQPLSLLVFCMSRSDLISSLRDVSPTILPSLLMCDFGNLAAEIETLEEAGVAALHLDVMDGVYVPNFTYGMTIVSAIRKLTELPLDVHLMMVSPEKYISQFVEAGADLITFHVETVDDPSAVVKQIHDLGVAAGVAINLETPVSAIASVLPEADMALVMSINAGFGGQAFNESAWDKLDEIRSLPGGKDVLLQIDGGINASTSKAATDHGTQLLVVGSAIFKKEDYAKAIESIMAEVTVS